jgi:drug/metabolite transporter (DMT)-like permease
MGLFATTAAALLYALMDPSAPYWQYGFPAAIICVLGADFAFACGTLFIAKIAQPHEQSVAGAIFQTIMALGTSVGLSITTVAEVAGMNAEARRLGVTVAPDAIVTQIPPSVLLKGYRTAQLAGVAFGACGEF